MILFTQYNRMPLDRQIDPLKLCIPRYVTMNDDNAFSIVHRNFYEKAFVRIGKENREQFSICASLQLLKTMSLFEDMKGRARLIFSLESRDDSEAEEQKQVDRLEEISEYCPQLTFQQRLIGFAVSFSLGCKFYTRKITRVECGAPIFLSDDEANFFSCRYDCFLFFPFFHPVGRREPNPLCLQLHYGSCSSAAGFYFSLRT